jgi:hypothetical protein
MAAKQELPERRSPAASEKEKLLPPNDRKSTTDERKVQASRGGRAVLAEREMYLSASAMNGKARNDSGS